MVDRRRGRAAAAGARSVINRPAEPQLQYAANYFKATVCVDGTLRFESSLAHRSVCHVTCYLAKNSGDERKIQYTA